jgi:IS5 family transposase
LFFAKQRIFSKYAANFIPIVVANPKTAPVEKPRQDELFCNRLENHIDLNHELVILANQINWSRFERDFADMFCEDRAAPALSIRLIVGLFISNTHFIFPTKRLRTVGSKIRTDNIFAAKRSFKLKRSFLALRL